MANAPVIPQIIHDDKRLVSILSPIKQLLDLREGRSGNSGQKVVTEERLAEALKEVYARIAAI